MIHLISLLAIASVAFAQEAPLFLQNDAADGNASCVDQDERCAAWSGQGECARNAAWMMQNCRRSCKSCQGGDTAWSLRTHLAEKYNKTDGKHNTTGNLVYISSVQLDHITVNEPQQIVQMYGQLVLTWNDSRVMWDKEKWSLSWLNFYWLQVWTPDLEQKNEPNSLYPGRITRKVLAANYTGQVYMWTDIALSVACEMDYQHYPNDVHQCCAKLDDKRYYSVRFEIRDAIRRALSDNLQRTHITGWTLEEIDVLSTAYEVKVHSEWQDEPYAIESNQCELCVRIKRRANYYTAELVLPAVATGVLTLISFIASSSWWPQIWLQIASILLQIASMMVLALKLPNGTQGTPHIVTYSAFNMAATIAAVIVSLLYRRLAMYRSAIPPPHTIDIIIGMVQKIAPCIADGRTEREDQASTDLDKMTSASKDVEGKMYWAPLASLLNKITFIVLLAIYIIMVTAEFVV